MESFGCTTIMDTNATAIAIAEDRVALYERIAKTITPHEDPRTAEVIRMYLDHWGRRLELARGKNPPP